MKGRTAVLLLLFLLLAPPAPALAGRTLDGSCDIRFLATSTLHDFSGTARCDPFRASLAAGPDGKTIIPSVEIEVPVGGMDTRNRSRDGQMREMFRGDRYPRIRGAVRDIDVDAARKEMARDGGGKAVLDLALRIRDVERRIRATATNLKEEGDRVSFDVEFPVSLKEYALKAPTVLGIIRVGDKVTVKGRVTLTEAKEAHP